MTSAIKTDALNELRDLRRSLHRQPELGFDVLVTAGELAKRLESAGLEVVSGVGGSGVVATLKRGSGSRVIGLRADMDALPITEQNSFEHRSTIPGRFHGCGHDGHSSMLLGAAQRLAEEGGFDGTIHFIFQPDEENGRGAQAMIDDGLFQRFPMDAIYGMHNLPGLPLGSFATRVGPFTAYEELFTITVQGRGGHASAPERAIDPLVPAAEILLALQSIVSRALAPSEHGVVSVTQFETDGARNVLPGQVIIRGDVRGYVESVSETIRRRMREIAEGVAAAHGATGTLDYVREFEPTVNTPDEVALAAKAVSRIEGATVDAEHEAKGFSEDFARFLRHRPGCYMLLGNGTEGSHGAALHNPHYDFNDNALPYGIAWWCALAREYLKP